MVSCALSDGGLWGSFVAHELTAVLNSYVVCPDHHQIVANQGGVARDSQMIERRLENTAD
jgi:hypothetical protein